MKQQIMILFLAIMLAVNPHNSFAGGQNQQDTIVHFAFLTDIHVTPGSDNAEHLKNVVAELNETPPDMVIINGDLTNQGSDSELTYVNEILSGLTVPVYVLPGNHESNWSESAMQTFSTLWDDDRFFFKKGPFALAGLNTGPYMRMGDGHIKVQDIRWLEETLKNETTPGTPVLFFAHYPLAEGLDQWYRITEILQQHNTVAAFCGHGHRLQLLSFDGIPGIMGRSLVLRGENTPGYNLVTVSPDSLWVHEKIVSKPMAEPAIRFALNDPSITKDIPVSSQPDYSVNEVYGDIQPAFFFQDTVSVFSGPLTLGDTIVVYGDSKGWLKSIGILSGGVQWQTPLRGNIYSTPVHAGDLIIAADTGGWVYGIDPADGKIHWQTHLAAPIVATPLVNQDDVYIGAATKAMYKLDIATGAILWRFDGVEGLIQSQPALWETNLVFTAWDTHVYCVDSESGTLRWKWNNGKSVALLSPGNVVPVISHNKVFIVAPDRFMTALSLENGKQLWRTNRHQVRESMGISQDGERIYAKLMNDSIIAVSAGADDFKTLWVEDAGYGYDHNPVPIVAKDGRLYTATRNGVIVSAEEKTGKVLWKHKTGNTAVNFFETRSNRYLWLTTTDGKIMAFPY